MEVFLRQCKERPLVIRQRQRIPRACLRVNARFTRIVVRCLCAAASQHNNCRILIRCKTVSIVRICLLDFLHGRLRRYQLRFIAWQDTHKTRREFIGVVVHLVLAYFRIGLPHLLIHLEAFFDECIPQLHVLSRFYCTADARPEIHLCFRANAQQCHSAALFQRQCAIVFQQHTAFCAEAFAHCAMRCNQLIRVGVIRHIGRIQCIVRFRDLNNSSLRSQIAVDHIAILLQYRARAIPDEHHADPKAAQSAPELFGFEHAFSLLLPVLRIHRCPACWKAHQAGISMTLGYTCAFT